jgi:hypothetical protein
MYLFALALAAAAQQPTATPNDVTVTGPAEPKVCRASGPDRSSSTRISRRRLCLTPTQWRHRERNNTEEGADTLDVIAGDNAIEVPNSNGGRTMSGGMAPR